MREMHPKVLERLRTITSKYNDSREASEQELRLYHWFHTYLFDEMLEIGGEERGYVFRQSHDGILLVYKATFAGVPQVVFITGRTPVDCMRIICRQFYQETLKWVPDKYA